MPRLNRRLVLEDLLRTPDGAGGYSEVWLPLGTVWADMRARSGREGESDHLRQSETQVKITLRAAPFGAPSRPKPDQRFVEGNRIYNIHAVVESDPSGRYLDCTATEEILT